MGKYVGDPRNKTGAPQKSPQAGLPVKSSGSYGQSKEGNVAGKGPNKPR